jgi:hypothetical protein
VDLTTAADTPLARRFAAALAFAEPSRARISRAGYTAAFLAAEPALATSPDRRRRLAAAIEELAAAGVVVVAKSLDRSEWPPVPRFIVLLERTPDPPVGQAAAAYAWRPELAWAARLPLRRSEFEALQAIQVFLRDRASDAPIVPAGERSLELFGDEKRLDALRHNRRLFGEGRLSLEMIRARHFAPPFAYRRVGDGPVALVLENVATYHSVLAAVPADSPIGLVIFGAGGNFAASVAYLAELAAEGPAESIREIRYFGDLDRRGLEMPAAADAAAREAGLPPVRAAIGLWALLLRNGRPAPAPKVPNDIAERINAWLPASLRPAAAEVLVGGARYAQEAVGTEMLAADGAWATWAGLGPPAVERAGEPEPELRRSIVRTPGPTGESALFTDDAGTATVPTEAEWDAWVPAGRTRNWVRGDPLLDWLRLYGAEAGFVPDDKRPGFDPRTDFRQFVLEKGIAFEAALVRLLGERAQIRTIAHERGDGRSEAKARDTVEALRDGTPIVAQGVLWNPARRTYGVADLLVRSDLLASWFPELLSWEEATIGAPGLGLEHVHYRPIDIKFHSFDLTTDGHVGNSADQLAYAVQVWLYAEALGRIQGYLPPAAYLLGRTWQQGDERGEGSLERLARVDLGRWLPHRGAMIEDVAAHAVTWIRRLRAEGAVWQVLPEPTKPELYPHARNTEDAPWHTAKAEIAKELGELTLLPAMNPDRRAAAHLNGMRRWDDPRVSAISLGITSPTFAARADAVLAVNRAAEPTVLPDRIVIADPAWRDVAPLEFYVDFETVSNLDDDFSALPRMGGQPLIVQIGCGHVDQSRAWCFSQWTVDALTAVEERRILDAWVRHLASVAARERNALVDARLYHWSAAEPVNLETAYNAARTRHPDVDWPAALPWFDLLERVIRAEPVAVTGAFNFGLKSIAKAMQANGLITTVWGAGPTDGLGAMVGTWAAAHEAATGALPLSKHPLMRNIASYNEVDCRVMAEALAWLRNNR